jgi:hypothetical protein
MKTGPINNGMLVVSFSLVLSLLVGCDAPYDQIENKEFKKQVAVFLNKVMSIQDNKPVYFRMDTLTKFKWDRMHVFSGEVTAEAMNKELGTEWSYSEKFCDFWPDGNRLIIFVKDKKVVSSAYFIQGEEPYVDLQFAIQNISSDSSLFSIQKQYYNNTVSTLLISSYQKKIPVTGRSDP